MTPSRLILLACLSASFLVALPVGLVSAGRASDPFTTQPELALQAPGTSEWMGRDELGRSLSARLMLAGGLSLSAASLALLLALSLAMVLGGIAGWYHELWPDKVISWLIALLHTIPFFLLVVVAAAVWRPGFFGAFVIVGLCAWAAPARLARAEFIRLRNARHVQAARAFGFPAVTLMLRHALPVAFLPAFVAVLLLMPELMGLDVGLGFFGLGAQPPTPTLGRLLFSGISRLNAAPWLCLAPCVMLVLLSLLAFGLAVLWSRSIPSASRA